MNALVQADRASGARTLLVFRLGADAFALPVERVHGLLDPLPATPVPNAPAIAPALVNVRGSVIALVDPRPRLGTEALARSTRTRLVVVETVLGDETERVAFEADAVEAVIEAAGPDAVPVPALGARWPAGTVTGALVDDRHGVVFLLDPDIALAPTLGADPSAALGEEPRP